MKTRALLIAMCGPAIQIAGIAWEALNIAAYHLHSPLSARHIIFDPAFLMIFVGLLVTLFCVPVALEVVTATESDISLPVFDHERVASDERKLAPEA